MHTHFLSDSVVKAYICDLCDRLLALGSDLPSTWVALGPSGDKIVEALLDALDDNVPSDLSVVRLAVERESGKVLLRDAEETFAANPKGAFIIDGPVHSGASMQVVAEWLLKNEVKRIISYGLVVKRTSYFIPTFFGLMIEEHDRAIFQLEKIPNNRIFAKRPAFGLLRAISENDVSRTDQTLDTGVPSLDAISLADLWYGHRTRGDHVYVYEIAGKVAGYIHFYQSSNSAIFIDAVAIDGAHQDSGIGSALMRWIENWARCHYCAKIELYAIEDRVGFYKKMGYEQVSSKPLRLSNNETYHHMSRRILYNINPDKEPYSFGPWMQPRM